MAQNCKQLTSRKPRTWVFNTLATANMAPVTQTGALTNAGIVATYPLPTAMKVVKVAAAFIATTDTAANVSFNIVYNTVAALASSQTLTAGNVAPNDNSYAYGSTTLKNAALTTALPLFNQQPGLGIPTNVAVDGQALFAADVALNTTNFPGSTNSTGGQGLFVPTNFDAVYPAGPYPYGAANGMTVPILAAFTLRLTLAGAATLTGFSVTLFLEPVTLWEKAPVDSTGIEAPGTTY